MERFWGGVTTSINKCRKTTSLPTCHKAWITFGWFCYTAVCPSSHNVPTMPIRTNDINKDGQTIHFLPLYTGETKKKSRISHLLESVCAADWGTLMSSVFIHRTVPQLWGPFHKRKLLQPFLTLTRKSPRIYSTQHFAYRLDITSPDAAHTTEIHTEQRETLNLQQMNVKEKTPHNSKVFCTVKVKHSKWHNNKQKAFLEFTLHCEKKVVQPIKRTSYSLSTSKTKSVIRAVAEKVLFCKLSNSAAVYYNHWFSFQCAWQIWGIRQPQSLTDKNIL